MKKNFDLSKLKKPTTKHLNPVVENPVLNITKNSTKKEAKENKVERVRKTGKIGRPMSGDEPLTEKVALNLTISEMEKLRNKIGELVPVAAYLRNELKEKGII
jgi:hypothetical protein